MKYTVLTELQMDGFQKCLVKEWKQNFNYVAMACGITAIAQMKFTVQFNVVLNPYAPFSNNIAICFTSEHI